MSQVALDISVDGNAASDALVSALPELLRPKQITLRAAETTGSERATFKTLKAAREHAADIGAPPGQHTLFEFRGANQRRGIPNRWAVWQVDDAPLIAQNDIARAEVAFDERRRAVVLIDITKGSAKRFETWTRDHVGQYVAICVDDRVMSAVMVDEPIDGGRIRIQMSSGTPAEVTAEARALARAVGGKPLRGQWTVSSVHELVDGKPKP